METPDDFSIYDDLLKESQSTEEAIGHRKNQELVLKEVQQHQGQGHVLYYAHLTDGDTEDVDKKYLHFKIKKADGELYYLYNKHTKKWLTTRAVPPRVSDIKHS